jgi:hypothetical protein
MAFQNTKEAIEALKELRSKVAARDVVIINSLIDFLKVEANNRGEGDEDGGRLESESVGVPPTEPATEAQKRAATAQLRPDEVAQLRRTGTCPVAFLAHKRRLAAQDRARRNGGE